MCSDFWGQIGLPECKWETWPKNEVLSSGEPSLSALVNPPFGESNYRKSVLFFGDKLNKIKLNGKLTKIFGCHWATLSKSQFTVTERVDLRHFCPWRHPKCMEPSKIRTIHGCPGCFPAPILWHRLLYMTLIWLCDFVWNLGSVFHPNWNFTWK